MVKKYILNTQDYTFAHFEHEGFGGIHKYTATPKKKGLPKLLVKHENSYAACSEFFTSRIAELLNIKTPTSYLMSISPEDKGLFETPFVVGIEYIDDLTGVIPYDHMDDDPSLRFDLINAFALYAMFGVHSDNLQCCYSPSRGIISIDFEQYFGFFEKYKDLFNLSDKDIERTTLDLLDYLKHNSFEREARICSDMLSEKLQIPAEKLYSQFHFSMKRLCKITEKELPPIYDALSEIYPIYAETFYYGYLLILKKKIESYIPNAAHYIPLEQVTDASEYEPCKNCNP